MLVATALIAAATIGATAIAPAPAGAQAAAPRATTRLTLSSRNLDFGFQRVGTAGKLINDPALFDAANRLVVGVDESALLRWLIKDRQKSGIKKEYNEEVRRQTAAAQPQPVAAGARTPTPPPR